MKLKAKSKPKPKAKMFGNRIKIILKEKGMSPVELADIIETTPSHISRIINGQRRCISLPIAIKIALALGTPVEEVFIYKQPIISVVNNKEGDDAE
jgi:plasmid maintenance system antidote protein VapI